MATKTKKRRIKTRTRVARTVDPVRQSIDRAVSSNLNAFLTAQDTTQKAFVGLSGVDGATINRTCAGVAPKVHHCKRIADAMGVTMDQLITLNGQPTPAHRKREDYRLDSGDPEKLRGVNERYKKLRDKKEAAAAKEPRS